MTLDEFKKQVDEATETYGKTLHMVIAEAAKDKLDPNILFAIIERSFENLKNLGD